MVTDDSQRLATFPSDLKLTGDLNNQSVGPKAEKLARIRRRKKKLCWDNYTSLTKLQIEKKKIRNPIQTRPDQTKESRD